MFELTKQEWNELVTNCDQFPENLKHSYINPTVFCVLCKGLHNSHYVNKKIM